MLANILHTPLDKAQLEAAKTASIQFGIAGPEPIYGRTSRPVMLVLRDPVTDATSLLKEKHDYLGDDEFRMHVALHRYVLERGGPVAPLRTTSKGADVLETSDGRLAEWQAIVPGREARIDSLADATEMAECLAKFHTTAFEFSSNVRHAEPRLLSEKALFYVSIVEQRIGTSNTLPLRRSLERAIDQASTMVTRIKDAHWTMRATLHGDPAPSNFIFNDMRATIIDLDDAHEGALIEDLARLLAYTAVLRHFEAEGVQCKVPDDWSCSTTEDMLVAYAHEASLVPVPLSQLMPWLAIATICSVLDIFIPLSNGKELQDVCSQVCHLTATMLRE